MGVTACVHRLNAQPYSRDAYSECCWESPRAFMSKKMPGLPSAASPAWAKWSPRWVLPIPVAP